MPSRRGLLPDRLAGPALRLAFYEWAYGRLGEMDDGLGPLGEYVVGLRVGGLDGMRREKSAVDLVAADGTTYEIKTTGRPKNDGMHRPRRTWTIRDEADALEGRAQLADRWVFLVADFPPLAARLRFFNAFASRWWRAYVLTGEQVRGTGVRHLVTEATLARAGAAPQPLSVLGAARPRTSLAQRLRFFRWAYGELSEPFNFGRLAEFQVLRACGHPTLARSSWGATDLVSRGGSTLEVKASVRARHTKAGTPFREFFLPLRRVAPRPGAERRRTADFFVFAWCARETVSMALADWRFICVPTADLEHATYVRTTKLAKLGHPVLTARQLRDALA